MMALASTGSLLAVIIMGWMKRPAQELAQSYHTSRGTIRQALSILVNEGWKQNGSRTVPLLYSPQDASPAEHQIGLRARSREGVHAYDQTRPYPRSNLFTIRVWREEIGPDQTEWRGKVHLITNGNVHYFRRWEGLVPLLLTMLS